MSLENAKVWGQVRALSAKFAYQLEKPIMLKCWWKKSFEVRNEAIVHHFPTTIWYADPRCGRQEIAPGIRRSTRKKQEPLQWWRGEVKQFTREDHK